jgi:hypothetical protein
VKELLAVVGLAEPGSGPVAVKELRMRDLPSLPVETAMTDLLNLFQVSRDLVFCVYLLSKCAGCGACERVRGCDSACSHGHDRLA